VSRTRGRRFHFAAAPKNNRLRVSCCQSVTPPKQLKCCCGNHTPFATPPLWKSLSRSELSQDNRRHFDSPKRTPAYRSLMLLCSPANQYPVAALKQRTALVHPLADAAGLLAQRNPVCSGGTYGGTSFCFSVLIKLALMSGGIILGCVRQDSYKFYRNCFNCWRRVFVRQETQMKLASCSMCDPSYALRSAIVVHACLTWRRPPTKVKLCFTKAQLIRRLGPRQTVNGFVLGKQAQPGHFEEGRS